MARKRLSHKEVKKLVLKVVADCNSLAESHIKKWKPVDKKWPTIDGAVYLRLSDDTQVAVERGSLEQQIHIAVAEAQYRSEQEKMNFKITDFYIEPGITGTHDNRPEFIRLQQNISLQAHKFVIFKEISRIVRDVEIWKRFFKLCQTNDCEICLRGLPFNPNDPASILQLDQLAAYAEFESRTTSKRIKESVHSALITSGKFNGNYPLLGFDAIKNEHDESTGIYKPNKQELKQIQWIMEAFLRVDRYGALVEQCKARGVKNKKGQDFTPQTIKALLTNPRYIGKWYRNKKNKEKRQSKLMPYDRYTEVNFDYGCVIEMMLWEKVQKKVDEMDRIRTKKTNRCYPLSTILVLDDDSTFVGQSAKGRNGGFLYYYNKSKNVRVSAKAIEEEASKILSGIIDNSDKFQNSVAKQLASKDKALDFTNIKIDEIECKLEELESEKTRLDKRLNFLLDDDDLEVAQSFKEEYKRQYVEMKQRQTALEDKKNKLLLLNKQLLQTEGYGKEDLKIVSKALNLVKKKDLISLKSIYRKLFQKIIVRPLDNSKIELNFILHQVSSTLRRVEDTFCITLKLVEDTGIEPATS